MKRLLLSIPLVITVAGCASDAPAPAPAPATTPSTASGSAPRSTVVVAPSSSPITAAAEREILRRQEAIRRADEAALRAQRHMADGDYEKAMASSREALSR